MKKVPIQILLGRGAQQRLVTIHLGVAEIRALRRDAIAAGVSLRDWITTRLRQSIDKLETGPGPEPESRSGLPFPFFPEARPRL